MSDICRPQSVAQLATIEVQVFAQSLEARNRFAGHIIEKYAGKHA
jgi:hypothetical protein